MSEGVSLAGFVTGHIASFGLGVLLGTVFLWGLWLTVQRLPTAAHPAIMMLASLLLRFGVTLAGFLVIARIGSWEHLLVAAAGFTLPRLMIGRRLKSTLGREDPQA
ncbi:MAG: ATP synthase subunit I [Marinobacter sp.]|uniref:N-ATPase subunit AtpR n=1 Tax=Marinobacter sp. TaxID=50741 RepID=UPI00396EBF2D